LKKPKVREFIESMSVSAVDVMQEILAYKSVSEDGKVDVPVASLKLNAAKDILDRSGYGKQEDPDANKGQVEITFNFFSNKDATI